MDETFEEDEENNEIINQFPNIPEPPPLTPPPTQLSTDFINTQDYIEIRIKIRIKIFLITNKI